MICSKILEEVFLPLRGSSPSTAQDDPQTNPVARRRNLATTHFPKPPWQILALLRTSREAETRGPLQTILYPNGRYALSASQ